MDINELKAILHWDLFFHYFQLPIHLLLEQKVPIFDNLGLNLAY